MSEETLRALIRYVQPASQLRKDVEQSLMLETFSGTGDMLMRTYRGLHDSISRIVDDPYLEALTIEVNDEATDREKALLVMIASGQLLAYLQSQTGVPVGLDGGGNHHIQTAPQIVINANQAGNTDEMMKMVNKALGTDESDDE